MEIPVQFSSSRAAGLRLLVLLSLGALLASCAGIPRPYAMVGLDSPRPPINRGRVTLELVDEYGMQMAGYMVDFGWEEPTFYKTRASTDRNGRVTFSGVPEVAQVAIWHEGGYWEQTLIVPQSGRADLRVMLDTRGGYQARLAQERERLLPPSARTTAK
jgi:hypothetical protein